MCLGQVSLLPLAGWVMNINPPSVSYGVKSSVADWVYMTACCSTDPTVH